MQTSRSINDFWTSFHHEGLASFCRASSLSKMLMSQVAIWCSSEHFLAEQLEAPDAFLDLTVASFEPLIPGSGGGVLLRRRRSLPALLERESPRRI